METKTPEKTLIENYISVTEVEGMWRAQWRYRGMNWGWARFMNGNIREWTSKKSAEKYITKAWPEAKWVN